MENEEVEDRQRRFLLVYSANLVIMEWTHGMVLWIRTFIPKLPCNAISTRIHSKTRGSRKRLPATSKSLLWQSKLDKFVFLTKIELHIVSHKNKRHIQTYNQKKGLNISIHNMIIKIAYNQHKKCYSMIIHDIRKPGTKHRHNKCK